MLSVEIVQAFRESQRLFNDIVYSNLDAIGQTHAGAAYFGLIFAGFAYGALHAIGPGHGKVIVSGYVFANESSLKRGLAVVALSSLLQAVTAILLVTGFYYLLKTTRAEAERIAGLLETGSFVIIGGLGASLLAQGARDFIRVLHPSAVNAGQGTRKGEWHGHAHHDPHCACGHAHMPSADKIARAGHTASLAAMIISIGIRPCTGALLLLYFSCMAQLMMAGVLATFAMAAGTALTTGTLAVLAVKSRKLAMRFASRSERRLRFAESSLRLLGGIVIVALAGLFLILHLRGETLPAQASHPLYKSLR